MLNSQQMFGDNQRGNINFEGNPSRLSDEVWGEMRGLAQAAHALSHDQGSQHHKPPDQPVLVAQAGERGHRDLVHPQFVDQPHNVEVAFRHIFVLADRNHDGVISADEARQLLTNRDLRGTNACVAAVLRLYFDQIRVLRNDGGGGITRADLNRLTSLWRQRVDGGEMSNSDRNLIEGMRRRIRLAQQMLETSSMELYGNHQHPRQSIRAEAVIQSAQADNCNFVAGLAGLAESNPAAVMSMIRDNGDGTCLVCFPREMSAGSERRDVTVRVPTQAELAYHLTGSPHGTWATVLQAAHGRWLDRDAPPGGEIEAGSGWGIYRGLNLLTGEPYGFWPMRFMWDSTLYRIVNEHARDRLPISAILTSLPMVEDSDRDAVLGLPLWHHYCVLRIIDHPNHRGDMRYSTVELYNPHGASGLSATVPRDVRDLGGGRFRMSFTRFAARFNVLVYR